MMHRSSLVLGALLLAIANACTKPEPPAPPAPANPTPTSNPIASAPTSPVENAPPDAAAPVAAAWPPKTPPKIETDWCLEAVSALDEETCFVLPDKPTDALLIYLHGIVPPERESFQKTNLETVVANASRRAGVAALLPRGKRGMTPKGHERWWGWPTAETQYQKYTTPLAQLLSEKKLKLEQAIGARFEKVYLAGSSAGAYFVVAIALRGAFPADGFGAMSGGAGRPTPELPKLEKKPFYIGFGTQDSVGPAAKSLSELLARAGWPVKIVAHPVGHGAKEVYLDEAFAFWRQPSTSKSSSE